MIRNDRKYIFIRPFWFETSVESFSCAWAMDFGRMFSSHAESRREDASFWLAVRLRWGGSRCIIVGKYPRRVENLKLFVGCLYFRFWVLRVISNARVKPNMVTARAVILR